jgi:hypothetical protein
VGNHLHHWSRSRRGTVPGIHPARAPRRTGVVGPTNGLGRCMEKAQRGTAARSAESTTPEKSEALVSRRPWCHRFGLTANAAGRRHASAGGAGANSPSLSCGLTTFAGWGGRSRTPKPFRVGAATQRSMSPGRSARYGDRGAPPKPRLELCGNIGLPGMDSVTPGPYRGGRPGSPPRRQSDPGDGGLSQYGHPSPQPIR